MKTFFGIVVLFFLATSASFAQRAIEVDVCVYGGTSAGVIAAYTAQKLGKTAIVIEPGNRIGGLSSGGLGQTDIGNKYAVTGLARDFYRRVGDHYNKFEQWLFEPKVALSVFHDYVREGQFEVMYETRLKEVRKQGDRITEIVVENSKAPSRSTDIVIRAKMFIDCGYEGDLMARAGVSYAFGREANSDYNETINGVQVMDGHQFPEGIDPYKTPGKPKSGLLWGISNEPLAPQGSGDKKIQAYNYRICLTNEPGNMVPITQPDDYDSDRYNLLLRVFEAWPERRKLNHYFIWSHMPNNKTDINNRGPFSTDMIGMNYGYPEGTFEEREKIIRDHTSYTKGLLYFFGHDPRVPRELQEEMLQWGYPKDEYVDNGHWTPQLYIREARRMVGDYVMTQHNCEGREVVSDGVGLAAYTMDSHNTQRIVINGMVKNEGNVEVGGFGPYPIAYRSLTPKKNECTNLLVPVCLSATHMAFGSIRMEPVFMVLAQSAATAAVMAIDNNTSVQQIDVPTLQQRLKNDPLADGSIFEIMVDNRDSLQVKTKGAWTVQRGRAYGSDVLMSEPGQRAVATVRFAPEIPADGAYEGYIFIPKLKDMTSQTQVIVNTGKQTQAISIKTADIHVEGQTSGEWVPLGTFNLPKGTKSYVQVSTKDADGRVFADAIVWVPANKTR